MRSVSVEIVVEMVIMIKTIKVELIYYLQLRNNTCLPRCYCLGLA